MMIVEKPVQTKERASCDIFFLSFFLSFFGLSGKQPCYRIIWYTSPPPYVARARQMPSLRGGAYRKGIYYGGWSVRHINFAVTLRQEGACKQGGLICQIIRYC
jgi:hypothetical protein